MLVMMIMMMMVMIVVVVMVIIIITNACIVIIKNVFSAQIGCNCHLLGQQIIICRHIWTQTNFCLHVYKTNEDLPIQYVFAVCRYQCGHCAPMDIDKASICCCEVLQVWKLVDDFVTANREELECVTNHP